MSRYEREYQRFKRKYSQEFTEFRDKIEGQRSKEAFDVEDDLQDWEFAWRALQLWRKRVEILNNA